MADASLPAVSPAVERSLSDYVQGEIVALSSLPIELPRQRFRPSWSRRRTQVPTPNGVVVLSQDCDIVQSDRLTVQVAPIVILDGDVARQAESGHRPRYISIPNAGPGRFGDLECIATVHKNVLGKIPHRPGVSNTLESRKFAQAMGRRFTRFAFPGNLHPWLHPLEDVLQQKARRPQSPIGQVLAKVKEIRIHAAGGWQQAPYSLTVIIIVEEGELPGDQSASEAPAELTEYLRRSDGELKRTPGDIAGKLVAAIDPVTRYHLWLALGEAWAGLCHPRSTSQTVLDEVDSVEGEVVAESDLTLDRWWESEALDLDYLSGPRPG